MMHGGPRIGGVGAASAPASMCSASDDVSDEEDGSGLDRDSLDLNGLTETLVDSDDEEGYDEVSNEILFVAVDAAPN